MKKVVILLIIIIAMLGCERMGKIEETTYNGHRAYGQLSSNGLDYTFYTYPNCNYIAKLPAAEAWKLH